MTRWRVTNRMVSTPWSGMSPFLVNMTTLRPLTSYTPAIILPGSRRTHVKFKPVAHPQATAWACLVAGTAAMVTCVWLLVRMQVTICDILISFLGTLSEDPGTEPYEYLGVTTRGNCLSTRYGAGVPNDRQGVYCVLLVKHTSLPCQCGGFR